ncbi:hypothetical protein J8273_2004 [Carpediemonas membranifera]|uniref:Uncharacterized protein n=1 Tax=Carpediemonas membranifera TaxID=201153 RepID=A0A8J6B5T6_9EUKA|nr:hypothetical protein J8273_2004 [Carpediemonas membranifera]|eukprot:KAG9396273.1 hypothetical protein J8273_2004 [Carpediemonas membranifera]
MTQCSDNNAEHSAMIFIVDANDEVDASKLAPEADLRILIAKGASLSQLDALDVSVGTHGMSVYSFPDPTAKSKGLADQTSDEDLYSTQALLVTLQTHPWPDTTKPLPAILQDALTTITKDIAGLADEESDADFGRLLAAADTIRKFNQTAKTADERAAGRDAAAQMAMAIAELGM